MLNQLRNPWTNTDVHVKFKSTCCEVPTFRTYPEFGYSIKTAHFSNQLPRFNTFCWNLYSPLSSESSRGDKSIRIVSKRLLEWIGYHTCFWVYITFLRHSKYFILYKFYIWNMFIGNLFSDQNEILSWLQSTLDCSTMS